MCTVCGAVDCSYETHKRERNYVDVIRPKLMETIEAWPKSTTSNSEIVKAVKKAIKR